MEKIGSGSMFPQCKYHSKIYFNDLYFYFLNIKNTGILYNLNNQF